MMGILECWLRVSRILIGSEVRILMYVRIRVSIRLFYLVFFIFLRLNDLLGIRK